MTLLVIFTIFAVFTILARPVINDIRDMLVVASYPAVAGVGSVLINKAA